ncbi:hypothetical protein ACIQU6_30265 [Streptomyces sp. NPDC090442]
MAVEGNADVRRNRVHRAGCDPARASVDLIGACLCANLFTGTA